MSAAVWVRATLTAAAQHVPLGLDAYRPTPADNPLTAESVEEGRRLFFDRRLSRDESISCASCHVGPTLSDDRAHNTGITWRDGRVQDPGAGDGRFRTPTLREITRTAPYMHDGSVATIDEVIAYYDRGGNRHDLLDPDVKPLALSAGEKAQLKAFLHTLVGRVRDWVPIVSAGGSMANRS